MTLSDAQLHELYDKQKLHENMMLYCRGIDRYDEALIKSTYWEDSWDDHGSFVGPGPEWAAAGFSWRHLLHSNNHHVTNVLIELDGNRAKRESMFMCVVNLKEGKEASMSAFLGGRYRDLCEKRKGEWRILHRVCIWDWFESYPTTGGWHRLGIPKESSWGRFHPEDPIYQDWAERCHVDFPRPSSQYTGDKSKKDALAATSASS